MTCVIAADCNKWHWSESKHVQRACPAVRKALETDRAVFATALDTVMHYRVYSVLNHA